MIYHILIYRYPSRILLLGVIFKKIIKEDDIFSGFLSAIKSFATILLKNRPDTIQQIKFDSLYLDILPIKNLGVDVVILSDPVHQEVIRIVIENIEKIIYDHKSLFEECLKGSYSRLQILKEPILQVIRKTIYSKAIAGVI